MTCSCPAFSDVQAARGEIPKRDYRAFAAATSAVTHGIERVQKVDQGVLLELADGLRASSTLTPQARLAAGTRDNGGRNPDQVALVVVENRRRVVLTHDSVE